MRTVIFKCIPKTTFATFKSQDGNWQKYGLTPKKCTLQSSQYLNFEMKNLFANQKSQKICNCFKNQSDLVFNLGEGEMIFAVISFHDHVQNLHEGHNHLRINVTV